MKDGFIKTAAVSPKIRVADCGYNKNIMKEHIFQAADQRVQLLVFPELCLTGYTCGDLFLQQSMLDAAEKALCELAKETKNKGIMAIVGAPLRNRGKLYNCAVVLYDGEILGVVPKTYLPNYGEFYEQRHFTSAPETCSEITIEAEAYPFGTDLLFACRQLREFQLAAELCEDLWVPSPPSVRHAMAGATIVANLSASDEVIGKEDYRRSLVEGQSGRLVCGYIYADAGEGESSTDMVFAGHNLIAENGNLLAECMPFQKEMIVTELDVQFLEQERRRLSTFPLQQNPTHRVIEFDMPVTETQLTRKYSCTPFVPSDTKDKEHRCEMILSMQSQGLKKRLEHIGCKTAVIGVSGGLDSCLALLVTVRAFDQLKKDREDIVAVGMPCFGTTERTKNNARLLAERLGVTFRSIDITKAVLQHFEDIGHDADVHDVVYENTQARERTQVLMDIANQTNGIVVGTGDLSEAALGWSTYNGDHMSMYGVNASVPKTLVRHIVRYAADTAQTKAERSVLIDILNTPVSPELLPPVEGDISQKTEELVGPYALHDFFLYYLVRRNFRPLKIYRLACYAFADVYDSGTVLKWLKTFYRRFFTQQFKRSCTPDAPKVGTVTLSPRADWRMPSDASLSVWLDELNQIG
jgi:NAD+ synthase (glutamine-hydrolysing)